MGAERKITTLQKRLRLRDCVQLCCYRYFNFTKVKFENYVKKSDLFSTLEKKNIIKFFKEEIYPVDKDIAKWMWQLGSNDFCFKSNLQILKKNGYVIKKSKKTKTEKNSNS